jgi:hypothetical protein
VKKAAKYNAKPLSNYDKIIDRHYKDQFTNLVNSFIPEFIKGNTQLFSILRFNFSASIALVC